MKDENFENFAYFMGRLLKPFVAIWAPVYALQKVRCVQKYDDSHTEPINVQPENVQPEIDKEQIGGIVAKLESAPVLRVSYFEKTEHQPWAPSLCNFDDYVIQFSSAGTEWCGGMRGNGYISKKEINGTMTQICTISPELSDYLAQIAHRQYELMKAKNR